MFCVYEQYCFVPEDGAARLVSVNLGSRMPGCVGVSKGLSQDDPVIVTGQDRLSSGDRVRVLENDKAIPENRFISARES